jgi:hypothetical protein
MKKEIGVVGVDSGQIVICDPCYIDSEWEKEDFAERRRYHHAKSKRTLEFGRDFVKYDIPIIPYDKCMNDMLADKDVEKLPDGKPLYEFSYNACCTKTLSDEHDGQLNYRKGHPGVGVVSNTGWGDGLYPVIADIAPNGRVRSITIQFMDFEDDEEDGDI